MSDARVIVVVGSNEGLATTPLGNASQQRRRSAGLETMETNERIVMANGVDICVETFGQPDDPAILLIHGAAASMLWWEEEFCERLAAGPRFVIRYDHRDTGRSVTSPPGEPKYTGLDLVEDAVGVLDAIGVARAHLVGISMGGAFAQIIALEHADRVASLTLISTSPAVPTGGDLPPMPEEARARFAAVPAADWSDRAAVIDRGVALMRASAATSRPFDEAGARRLVARDVDRAINYASAENHHLAGGDDPSRKRLGSVSAPTLVLHGTEDPVFPYGHGVALAGEIPGARLIPMERTGHELPREVWDVVVPAILRHTSAG
jgi:pimeloyl-ACP methyl ester carboxylesterase